MKLHYLPSTEMTQEKNFPGWQIKPEIAFYERIQEGRLSKKATQLTGEWILVDSRNKPAEDRDGRQLYPNDFLGPIMEKLRGLGKLEECDIPQTRAFISWEEYHDILVPEIAKILKVKPDQVRLPRAIEFNFLGNAYYPQWGETNSWEWFEDRIYDKKCLSGGHSRHGGFADVYVDRFDVRFNDVGFRPLVEF